MGAVGTMDLFYANRSRTGGKLPLENQLAWVTLSLVLLLGASLQFAVTDAVGAANLSAAYSIAIDE